MVPEALTRGFAKLEPRLCSNRLEHSIIFFSSALKGCLFPCLLAISPRLVFWPPQPPIIKAEKARWPRVLSKCRRRADKRGNRRQVATARDAHAARRIRLRFPLSPLGATFFCCRVRSGDVQFDESRSNGRKRNAPVRREHGGTSPHDAAVKVALSRF